MQFQHQRGQRSFFSFWSAPATLALWLSQAMLGAKQGRSMASPSHSGSTAPARQKAVMYGQRAARLFVLLCVLASITGCAVVKATNQPDKKNLSVFSTGTPRSHVIAEVGAPTFTEEKDGQRVDIFAFKQGYSKGAKVGRAFFHGAADLMTLGMWEVVGTPFEAIADGTDMKIQVTYEQDRVKDVTYLAGR